MCHLTYFAVIGSIFHSQNQFRSVRGQQVLILSLIPLLPVENLQKIIRNVKTLNKCCDDVFSKWLCVISG